MYGNFYLKVGSDTWIAGEENFFLALVEPPKKEFWPDPLPREYIFILDSSGSMSGFPWEVRIFFGTFLIRF
jgi:Ca-activated chloride channel family protein